MSAPTAIRSGNVPHWSAAIDVGTLTGRMPTSVSALPHLVTVQICEPADGVAEISAIFLCADRVRALAFRLEGIDGRWRIIAMELG